MHGSKSIHPLTMALAFTVLVAAGLRAGTSAGTEVEHPVTAKDSGPKFVYNGWIAGHKDHKWKEQYVTLSSDIITYKLKYRACVDPSHPGVCAFDEGYIGMPAPSVANWYHTGFFHIEMNGKQLGIYPLTDLRVTETGSRGAFHMVWDTPDAVARVQFLLEPGSDHLLSRLAWTTKPGRTVHSVKVRFTCYPSFFTAAHNRKGDRTLTTPRTSVHEPGRVKLVPAEDAYLLYTDGVFDVAKGEGVGPCAMLFLPEQIADGSVHVTGYPVQTRLEAAPDIHQLRFAFWDLTGKTNADAHSYMTARAAQVQKHLREVNFRSEGLVRFDPTAAKAEIARLLTGAREDGNRLRPQAEALVRKLCTLKASADRGDWRAEARFASTYPKYQALLWKLKIYALLNAP